MFEVFPNRGANRCHRRCLGPETKHSKGVRPQCYPLNGSAVVSPCGSNLILVVEYTGLVYSTWNVEEKASCVPDLV